MNVRRWITLALVVLGMAAVGTACASAPVALDTVGLRYTPAQGEIIATRDNVPDSALSALGTDAQTLTAAMVRDGVWFTSIQADGRQFSLRIAAKPADITASDAAALSAAEREVFLTQLARQGGYGTAVWATGGYALFSAPVDAHVDSPLSYSGLTLATLYLNQVYALHMDVIGRQATQADADLLADAATRLLRLGAATTTDAGGASAEAALTLPDTAVASGVAEVSYQQQDLMLELDPIADTIGVTQFTLSGRTVPGGYLRFALGGSTSSRIKADESGAFRFTVPGLTGNAENPIEIIAFKGDQMTVASFTVKVVWQLTPLVLSPTSQAEGKTVTLNGLTLPGASVKITEGRGTGRIIVGEDGSFRVTLNLGRMGENSFTLQAQAAGYHRNDHPLRITRLLSQAEALETLQKKAKAVDYARLTADPSTFAARVVQLRGSVGTLFYEQGKAGYVLNTEQGDAYAVLCGDLLGVAEGAPTSLIGTLTGKMHAASGCPALTLAAYVP